MPRIYLAGPGVFMPDAGERGERLKAICAAYGCEGLYPLDAAISLPSKSRAKTRAIFDACLDMVRRADAVVADLSPFRGPHCDDGTAVEIGIATERGIPVFGYSDDLRPLAARIVHTIPLDGVFRDANGVEVENYGHPFNSMIAGALHTEAFPTPAEAIACAALYLSTDTTAPSP